MPRGTSVVPVVAYGAKTLLNNVPCIQSVVAVIGLLVISCNLNIFQLDNVKHLCLAGAM